MVHLTKKVTLVELHLICLTLNLKFLTATHSQWTQYITPKGGPKSGCHVSSSSYRLSENLHSERKSKTLYIRFYVKYSLQCIDEIFDNLNLNIVIVYKFHDMQNIMITAITLISIRTMMNNELYFLRAPWTMG